MGTLRLLEPGFHQSHFVDVLEQTFWAGIAGDDAFPPWLRRNLAPWPTLRSREFYVDEGALAVATAPPADRILAGRAAIGKRFYGIEAAESRGLAVAPSIQGAQRRADRAGFAAVRVDHDLRVGNLAGDEVDLGLDHRKIAVRAALKDEVASGGAQILQLAGINPNIERQHRGKGGHDLLRRPTLTLLVDDVRLQEHAASHGKHRQRFGLEGSLGVALERHAVALRDALQKRTIAGRALRVESEVGDG